MRLRTWWRRLALSATVIACSNNVALADQGPQTYPTTSPAQVNSHDMEIQQLREQLRIQNERLDAITKSIQRDNARTEAQFASMEEKKAEAVKPFETVDIVSKPTAKVFGRMYVDHIMYDDAPGLGVDRMNETGFDTGRIGIKGQVFENVQYKIQVEFEGTEVDYKDVFIQVDHMPGIGSVRVGHFKEPWSLEEQTSSRFVTFMERASATNVFSPQRNIGIMAFNTVGCNENLRWYMGTFRNDYDDSPTGTGSQQQDEGDWTYTARMCWLPYFDENAPGRYLMHIGGAFSYRETGAATKTFRSLAEVGTQASYLGNTFADTEWSQAGAEFAINWGAASFQAEAYTASIGGADVRGGYAQATYFLTGENRGYKRSSNGFSRVKPFENFFWVRTCDGTCRGIGAWELKARLSYIDLEDGGDAGGTSGIRGIGTNFATGFNWYLNPNCRFMFDYIHEDIDQLAASGVAHNFGMRFQVDF